MSFKHICLLKIIIRISYIHIINNIFFNIKIRDNILDQDN